MKAKEWSYNKKLKVVYHKELLDTAARSKTSYDKDPESGIKSTARSKVCYGKDLEKSHVDTAAHSKVSYDKEWN